MMNPAETDKSAVEFNLLRDIPTLIVAVSFISVTLAAIHEWGFFQIVGLHYLHFSSPIDYVTTVFSWLPIAIGILVSALVFHKKIPKFFSSTKKAISGCFWLGLSIILLATISRVFSPVVSFYSLTAITLLYVCLYDNYFRNASLAYNSYLLAALLAVTLSYVTGANDAMRTIDLHTPSKISVKDDDSARDVIVLRNFDKAILVEDMKRKEFEFYPWAEVNYISDPFWPSRHNSIACMISNRFCLPLSSLEKAGK
jgi:hypothetical protein